MTAAIYLAEGCRIYVLVVLLTAAWSKMFGFSRFRSALAEAFPILALRGNIGATVVAAGIVIGEWSAALLMLLGGALSRLGLVFALCLLLSLTVVVVLSLVQGRAIRCNCFGESDRRISKYDLVRNLVFVAVAAAGLLGVSYNAVSGTFGGLALQTYLPLGAVAVFFFLLSAGIHDIAGLLHARVDEP